MWLVTFIGVIFSGSFHVSRVASGMPAAIHIQNASSSPQIAKTIRPKPSCRVLKPGQTITTTVSFNGIACFLVEVESSQAQRLAITQPDDLEIHVSAEHFERLVDEFDMGNETVTLRTPGTYRVEVGRVKPIRETLTISASMQSFPLEQAAAWEDAEKWATMSKRSKTMESIDKSLAMWNQLGDTASIARTYLKRESVLRADDPTNARGAAEKALELCHVISDVRCSAEAANNSAFSSRKLGDVENATERYAEAAHDWQTLHDSLNEAVTRSNMGVLLWQSGDFERAFQELDRARLTLRGGDAGKYANVLNSFGLYYQSLAEYDKSRRYFENAIARFARKKMARELVRARLNLGRNYMLEGRLQRAQSILTQALFEADKLKDSHAKADVLRNLGQTLWRQGRTEQARSRLQEALEIDQFNRDRRGQSSALHYLGLIAEKDGDISGARDLLLQAVNLRRTSGQRDDAAESLSAIADLEYKAGNLYAARNFADQALEQLELVRSQVPGPALRASFYSRKRQFFNLLIEIALAPGTPEAQTEGLLAAERGRARSLMDMLSSGLLLQQLPPDLVQRRDSIQKQLDYLSSTATDKNGELRERINRLVTEAEEVEARIREFVVEEKLSTILNSVNEIQESLPADSAILEYNLGSQHSYMWLVDAQTIRLFYLPPAPKIEAAANRVVQYFGHLPDRQNSPDKQAAFKRAMNRLSAILLGKLSGVQLPQRLILVPDGVLHQVPFAALKSPGAAAPLGLSHDLVQIPSAAYLTLGKHPHPLSEFPQTILAMVDPVFSQTDPRMPHDRRKCQRVDSDLNLGRLPFTDEIDAIELIVPESREKVFRGFDASRQMLEGLHLEDFGVLHLSTHALIDDRIPEMSRIVLSRFNREGCSVDGVLRPDELAQFHLNGSIVVLSACNTALGQQVLGEGMMGLTSSLLVAGGSQLVLTLTEVDADASSDFFSEVYREFLAGSTSMEHSITLARATMASQHRFSDPYYWASFIVVGRPADEVQATAVPLSTSRRTK